MLTCTVPSLAGRVKTLCNSPLRTLAATCNDGNTGTMVRAVAIAATLGHSPRGSLVLHLLCTAMCQDNNCALSGCSADDVHQGMVFRLSGSCNVCTGALIVAPQVVTETSVDLD
jgi:hypothetical protein